MSTDPAQRDSDWLLFQKCSAMPEVNFCNLCSPTGRDFITKLLHIDPRRRMSIADALNHPWLSDATIAPVLAPPDASVELIAELGHEERSVCKEPCQSIRAPSDSGVIDMLWTGEVGDAIWFEMERQRVVGSGILAEWVRSAWTVKGEGSGWLW